MKILVIDDEPNISKVLKITLEGDGHHIQATDSKLGALQQLHKNVFDVAFLDLRLGQEDGLELLTILRQQNPPIAVIIMTAYGSIPTAVEAIRKGATDYLLKPFTPEQIRLSIERIEKTNILLKQVTELKSQVKAQSQEISFESEDLSMQSVLELAFKAAASHASILILGESGTGKSVLARAIHQRSLRKDSPFVTVSCPSLSRELLESELFGHVKGAFTGSIGNTHGKVHLASGGTLYLDEVGEISIDIQAKLLRLLQEREYERVGENLTRQADVRIISSTNQNLLEAITNGKFRNDLFYRLNVITLTMPPLRDRPRDLVMLAKSYLACFVKQLGKTIKGFSDEALTAMQNYSWPGNLRELRNEIERMVILSNSSQIELNDLSTNIRTISPPSKLELGNFISLADIEEEHIRRILAKTPRLEDATNILGIDPATLYRRRRKWIKDKR